MWKISCVFMSLFLVMALTSCISEEEKEEMRQMLKDSYSNSSSNSAKTTDNVDNSEQGRSADKSDNPTSNESGTTKADNKPPQSSSQKDGITIHIPQSDIDKFNSELEELRKEMEEYSIIEAPTFDTSRSDWEYSTPEFDNLDNYEFSVPNDWRSYAESRRDATANWR